MSDILEPMLNFYTDNQEFIDNLLSGGLPTILPAVVSFFWWLMWRQRQRRIPGESFAFEVIKPQSPDLMQRILGGNDQDPLADQNIPYQTRVANRSIRQELQQLLEANRWVLIIGRNGLGKTREASEVAKHFNQAGWTVLYLKPNEWLDVPARLPKSIGGDRKLLFLLDDLNQKMHRSYEEISPEAEKSLTERFTVPLQQRLLDTLTKYESFCGKAEIRVIATARNEKQPDFPGEANAWEKLQWEKYPKLWQQFQIYELPEPEDQAIVEVLSATVPKTKIPTQPEQYPELARRNDATFRNVVENLQRLRNDSLPLNANNYRESLGKTWENRYQESVKRYPGSRYIYDAVDLLRQFNIPLERFIVEATARMLAGGNCWQQLQHRCQINAAINFLTHAERILEPRDGQIEGKGNHVEAKEYILPFSKLILKLADQHPKEMQRLLLNFGVEMALANHQQEAIACWDKTIKIQPNYYPAWGNRGIVLTKLGRFAEAIASYDKVLAIKPDDYLAWYYRGNVLDEDGQHEQAIASYDKAVALKPDLHQAWNNRGIALRNLGRHQEALSSYNQALAIVPNLHQGWVNRGNALRNLGQFPEAVDSYNQALAIQPQDYYSWYSRGNCLKNLGELADAIASYDKALFIQPDADAWYNRGHILGDLGKYEDAVISYEKALFLKQDNHEAWYNHGNILLTLGRYEDAIASFEQAIAIKSHKDEAWNNRGNALFNLGRYEDAIKSYDQALLIQPQKHKAWKNRGNALFNLGKYEDAIKSYDQALAIKPDKHEAWYNRGNALRNSGKYQDAIKSYDQALLIKPDKHEAWNNRGLALTYLHRYHEAIASYDQALLITANNREAWYNKACCYGLLGNVDLAIENLQQVIKLDPDECREMAKTDSDFDNIRDDQRFQTLVMGDV
ncbi:MAG: tetratricopeptide repeat protein [Aulosira sp. DedQUE10]|nr:tetratricopeptide repeat protein [Aulosira sp. DedQUE10]